MKKSQIISTDFIITFMVYIFALSLFFFGIMQSISGSEPDLTFSTELIFERIDNLNNDEDFLQGSIIDAEKLDYFIKDNTAELAYKKLFQDFDNPGFSRIDYCVFVERIDSGDREILVNFAAGNQDDYSIYFQTTKCGDTPDQIYEEMPDCNVPQSILLTKPVLYKNHIANLKILICAE